MQIRLPNAAVAGGEPSSEIQRPQSCSAATAALTCPPTQTLWAHPAMCIRSGRLLGVRSFGQSLQVAILSSGSKRLQWVAADAVLNEFHVAQCLLSSKFTP
jgi:hypothetical protein